MAAFCYFKYVFYIFLSREKYVKKVLAKLPSQHISNLKPPHIIYEAILSYIMFQFIVAMVQKPYDTEQGSRVREASILMVLCFPYLHA